MVNPIFKFTRDHRGNCSFKFKFRIGLHISDRPLLGYIRNRLGLGKIDPISIESILPEKDKLTSVWEVYSFDDVLKIINIFDKYPSVAAIVMVTIVAFALAICLPMIAILTFASVASIVMVMIA